MPKLSEIYSSAETTTRAAIDHLDELASKAQALRQQLGAQLSASGRAVALLGDPDGAKLNEFMQKPYIIRPMGGDQYELIVPTFIGFNAGWPVRHQGPYSVFHVSRFINLINPLPEWLATELGYGAPTFNAVLEDNALVVEQGDPAEVAAKLGGKKHISRRDGNTLYIRPASRFHILRTIIREEGFLPFTARPIPAELLRFDRPDIKISLRPHQQREFERFLEVGAIAIFAYPQTGKSYVVLQALASLRGRKLIIVPRRTLVDQWQARIEMYLPPEYAAEVVITTYQALSRAPESILEQPWSLVVYDEAHHLPADFAIETASRLNTQSRMGLSATPRREDGNEDLIPALCGFPVGFDWPVSKAQRPPVSVWICRDEDEKLVQLRRIMHKPADGKSFVFTFRLEIGRRAAELLGVPFISAKTKKPLDIIEQSDTVVISSVGNEGLSFPVRRAVEIDFLYGSNMEAGQRLGRLAYEVTGLDTPGEHHILMTADEYHRYAKRLLQYEQWGLEVSVRMAGDEHEIAALAVSSARARSPRPAMPAVLSRAMTRPPERRARPVKPLSVPRPKDEIDDLLATPTVKNKFVKLDAGIADPTARAYLRKVFRVCYGAALSPTEIVEGLGLSTGATVERYKTACTRLVSAGLFKVDSAGRYTVDLDEINRLRNLAGMVRR